MNLFKKFFRALKDDTLFALFTFLFLILFLWTMHQDESRLAPGFTLLWGAISMNLPSVVVFFYAIYCVASGRLNLNMRRDQGEYIVNVLGKADQVTLRSIDKRDDDHVLVNDDFEIEEVE